MNDIIQINPKEIILARDKATGITLSVSAEDELEKILNAKKLIDEVLEFVKTRLSEEMGKEKLVKITSNKFHISKRAYGGRYKLTGLPVEERFKYLVTYDKVNTEEVDKFLAEKNQLPEGVELKERTETVSIEERKDEL